MAWTVDSIATPLVEETLSTATVSHTLGSGSNRIVIAVVGCEGVNASGGVTYNGVAMTAATNPASGQTEARIFYILEANLPAAGTYNCVATFSGTTNGRHLHVGSFTGVAQTAPESTVGQNYGNVSSISDSVTPTTGDALIVSILSVLDPRTITNTSGQTNRSNLSPTGSTPRRTRFATQLGPTTPASTAVSYTLSAASGTNGHHAAAFGIATGAPTVPVKMNIYRQMRA